VEYWVYVHRGGKLELVSIFAYLFDDRQGVTLGIVSAVRRGIRLFGFRFFPKIQLGSKLIDHRPNELKGVSSEVFGVFVG
jgi:hypothetical protein